MQYETDLERRVVKELGILGFAYGGRLVMANGVGLMHATKDKALVDRAAGLLQRMGFESMNDAEGDASLAPESRGAFSIGYFPPSTIAPGYSLRVLILVTKEMLDAEKLQA